jgi:hypothetical protein
MRALWIAILMVAITSEPALTPERPELVMPKGDSEKTRTTDYLKRGEYFLSLFTDACQTAKYDDPCIIHASPGGFVYEFRRAALELAGKFKQTVVIDGPCASACVLFADYGKAWVCITDRATFQFHKVRVYDENKKFLWYEDPEHLPEVSSWVALNGGYPRDGELAMSNAEAKKIWRSCNLNPPLPRPKPQPPR